jgi:hypothetical protein
MEKFVKVPTHARRPTTNTRPRELVVRASKVGRATVAQCSVAFKRQLRVRIDVGDVAGVACRRQAEVVALLQSAEVVQISTAAVERELGALLGDNVEVVTR